MSFYFLPLFIHLFSSPVIRHKANLVLTNAKRVQDALSPPLNDLWVYRTTTTAQWKLECRELDQNRKLITHRGEFFHLRGPNLCHSLKGVILPNEPQKRNSFTFSNYAQLHGRIGALICSAGRCPSNRKRRIRDNLRHGERLHWVHIIVECCRSIDFWDIIHGRGRNPGLEGIVKTCQGSSY